MKYLTLTEKVKDNTVFTVLSLYIVDYQEWMNYQKWMNSWNNMNELSGMYESMKYNELIIGNVGKRMHDYQEWIGMNGLSGM